uniref:Uncharacterized protein n=1 Tax=Timema cristinae TaxID=61476 RepID=A0A7R9CBP9_TIMCR|nr:unnamed protein product [Timema cristinae]
MALKPLMEPTHIKLAHFMCMLHFMTKGQPPKFEDMKKEFGKVCHGEIENACEFLMKHTYATEDVSHIRKNIELKRKREASGLTNQKTSLKRSIAKMKQLIAEDTLVYEELIQHHLLEEHKLNEQRDLVEELNDKVYLLTCKTQDVKEELTCCKDACDIADVCFRKFKTEENETQLNVESSDSSSLNRTIQDFVSVFVLHKQLTYVDQSAGRDDIKHPFLRETESELTNIHSKRKEQKMKIARCVSNMNRIMSDIFQMYSTTLRLHRKTLAEVSKGSLKILDVTPLRHAVKQLPQLWVEEVESFASVSLKSLDGITFQENPKPQRIISPLTLCLEVPVDFPSDQVIDLFGHFPLCDPAHIVVDLVGTLVKERTLERLEAEQVGPQDFYMANVDEMKLEDESFISTTHKHLSSIAHLTAKLQNMCELWEKDIAFWWEQPLKAVAENMIVGKGITFHEFKEEYAKMSQLETKKLFLTPIGRKRHDSMYVVWSLHEYTRDNFDFGDGGTVLSPFLDVVKYLKIAQEEDLFVVMRSGPYIGSELDMVIETANFGSNISENLNQLKSLQPNLPAWVSEYWTGYFDFWFDGFHHNTTTENYDAPLSESGDYTEKYNRTAPLIAQYLAVQTKLPQLPQQSIRVAYPSTPITSQLTYNNILDQLTADDRDTSTDLIAMEQTDVNNGSGQSYGFIVYRKRDLEIPETSILRLETVVRDVGMVLVDGVRKTEPLVQSSQIGGFGYWGNSNQQFNLDSTSVGSNRTLDLFVEEWGRGGDHKGVFGGSLYLNEERLQDWEIIALQFKLDNWLSSLTNWEDFDGISYNPTLYRATLDISGNPKDTFINMSAWGKGNVFINNFNLGRYFSAGPALTLYIPAPLLRKGQNEVTKVKKFTTLFDLQEIDWNEDVYKVIRDFFINPTECILTIFFDEDKLSAKLGFPSKPAHDMTYFMKEPTDSITPTNFYKVINFGTIGPHVEGSILNVMENVYAPMFFNTTSWPDSILCS